MRHLFALLLAALWSFAPVASFELVGSAIAGQHSSECAGKTPRNVHDHPRADNPWMILPGVEEHWIQIGCFVQPAFVNRNVTADVGWYIAGMNLNPLWR